MGVRGGRYARAPDRLGLWVLSSATRWVSLGKRAVFAGVVGAIALALVALLEAVLGGGLSASASAAGDSVAPVTAASAKTRQVVAARDGAVPCSQLPRHRDPRNPLDLASAPGTDPLAGASFFVDGPSHGAAAGEIARRLGIDRWVPVGQYLPAFPDGESWETFLNTTVADRLPTASAAVRRKVEMLEKIAVEPEAQRISAFSEGGSPEGIAAFTNKLFCHNFTADPGTVPIITTYFMHPALGGCPTTAQIDAYMPLFTSRVNAVVTATGSRAVVYLLELDVVGSSGCIRSDGALPAWEQMLRFEVDRMASLPHAVVYIEGGYSDSTTPAQAAQILNAADIRRVRG